MPGDAKATASDDSFFGGSGRPGEYQAALPTYSTPSAYSDRPGDYRRTHSHLPFSAFERVRRGFGELLPAAYACWPIYLLQCALRRLGENFDRPEHLGSVWPPAQRIRPSRALRLRIALVPPLAEVMERRIGIGRRTSLWTAFLFVGAFSAVYEVFEWLLTMVLAPEMATEYNGQQGDLWDPQKDMAIAIIGAALSSIWLSRARPLRSG